MATISHKNLTGTQLHDVKGVASATDDHVLTATSGASVFKKLTHLNLTTTGNPFGAQLLHVRDQRTTASSGQSYSSGTNTKVLQTVVTNEISGTALSSNQITGVTAGVYWVEAHVAQSSATSCRLVLYNVTDSANLVVGLSATTANAGTCSLRGRFTLAGTKTLELRLWAAGSSGTTGMNNGFDEVFSDLMIWKLS